MGFDDFHVIVVAQCGGGLAQQLQTDIHADAEIGGHADRYVPGGHFQGLALGLVETGGADHQRGMAGLADLQRGQGAGGARKIDHRVEFGLDLIQAGNQLRALVRQPGQAADMLADGIGGNRAHHFYLRKTVRALGQGAAHAAAGTMQHHPANTVGHQTSTLCSGEAKPKASAPSPTLTTPVMLITLRYRVTPWASAVFSSAA